ncbi:MAG: DMT family transporter [Vulcanimicrobiaceae bacterium]
MSTGNRAAVSDSHGSLAPALRLLGAQVAIGAAAIFARYALHGAGPLAVSALRLGIAALLFLVLAGRIRRLSARREWAFALAGLALAVHFAAWIASLQFTSVAVSTLLVTTTPVWTEAFDIVRERRGPSPAYGCALLCALGGVALIASERAASAPLPGHAFLGDGLALLGSVAIGAYLLVVRDAGAARDSTRVGTRQIVARTYGWSALALVVAATSFNERVPASTDAAAWAGILAMALLSQSLGHTALNAALRDFTPSTIALSTLLEPVIAALLAALLFGEVLTPKTVVGGTLVLVAVGATLRASASRAPARTVRQSDIL